MTEKEALQKSVSALSRIIKPKPPVEKKSAPTRQP